MFTTCRHTTATALSLVATATLAACLTTPAAHAQPTDIHFGYASQPTTMSAEVAEVGEAVALRKAQQAGYLVQYRLLAYR